MSTSFRDHGSYLDFVKATYPSKVQYAEKLCGEGNQGWEYHEWPEVDIVQLKDNSEYHVERIQAKYSNQTSIHNQAQKFKAFVSATDQKCQALYIIINSTRSIYGNRKYGYHHGRLLFARQLMEALYADPELIWNLCPWLVREAEHINSYSDAAPLFNDFLKCPWLELRCLDATIFDLSNGCQLATLCPQIC